MIIRSITAQDDKERPSKLIMRLKTSSSTRTILAHSMNRRMISICLISLATLTIILATSVQQNDAASVGKYKSSRDRGCYYMLQHFKNGEQIKTDEPCLNCTCENSMLMCYLRVCPYVKPVGDRCIIERVPGECCPKITCSDVGLNPESFEQEIEPATSAPVTSTTTLPTTTTTASTSISAANGYDVTFTNASEVQSGVGGCMLNNNYYHEGAQMPSDPSKPCEVCYCIRNSSACVMQDCALDVGGCTPIYQAGGCCPTRYNCSAVNAFTTPRPQSGFKAPDSSGRRRFWESNSVSKLLSLPTPQDQITSISSTTMKPIAFPDFGRTTKLPAPGCKSQNSTRTYLDGERIPSKNKCEHCYCMRNEIVCAVQECRPPCDGCVPIIDTNDQCCPKRYECAAPTQRVPTDNLIDIQETNTSISPILPINGDSTSTIATITSSETTNASKSIEDTNVVTTKSESAISTATPTLVDEASSNPTDQLSLEEKPKSGVSVMTTRQTKPPLRPISPKLSVNEDDNSNEMVSEQDSGKSLKTDSQESPPPSSNVDGFNLHGEREQENDLSKAAGRFVGPEGPPPTSLNQMQDATETVPPAITSTIAPIGIGTGQSSATVAGVQTPKIEVTNSNDMSVRPDQERKVRPPVVPSSIPGEGSCRYNGKMYQNGQEVKSKDSCMEICMCINSVVYCDEVDCPKAPENQDRCQRVLAEGECCPRFICDEPSSTTSVQPSTVAPDSVSSSVETTPNISSISELIESFQTTTSMPTSAMDRGVAGSMNITPETQNLPALEKASSERPPSDTPIFDTSRGPVQEFGTTDSSITVTSTLMPILSSSNDSYDSSISQDTSTPMPVFSPSSTLYDILASKDATTSTSAPAVSETTPGQTPSSPETASSNDVTSRFDQPNSTIGAGSTSEPIISTLPNEMVASAQDSAKSADPALPTTTIAIVTEAPTEGPASVVDQSTQAPASESVSSNDNLEAKPDLVANSQSGVVASTSTSVPTIIVTDGAPRESAPNDVSSAVGPAGSESTSASQSPGQESRSEIVPTVAEPASSGQPIATEAPLATVNEASASSKSEVQPDTNEINLAGVTVGAASPTTTTTAPTTATPLSDIASTNPAFSSSSVSDLEATTSQDQKSRVESSSVENTTAAGPAETSASTSAPVASETSAPALSESSATLPDNLPPKLPEAGIVNELERAPESIAPTTVASLSLLNKADQSSTASSSPPDVISSLPPAIELTSSNSTSETSSTTEVSAEPASSSTGVQPSTEPTVVSYGEGVLKDTSRATAVDSMLTESVSNGASLSSGSTIARTESNSPRQDQIVSVSSVEPVSPVSTAAPPMTTANLSPELSFGSENTSSSASAQALPDFTEVKTTITRNPSEIGNQTGVDQSLSSKTEETQSVPVNSTSSIGQQDGNSLSSTIAPPSSSVTTSPADEFLASVTTESVGFKPVDVTTTIPSIRGSSASITIPWSDISNSSSSNAEQTTTSLSVSSTVNSTSFGTKSYVHEPTQSSIGLESDYEEVTEDTGCEYEGKTYNSAQQIPRSHPCDFCFCFRGDIICLQQTCPPPVPHCFETVMDGFCCPRYECPVHTVRSSPNSTSLSLTPYDSHSRIHAHSHETGRPQSTRGSSVRGCFVDNKLYGVGQVIESASGPCMECKCDKSGMMKCNPKECTPEDPLLQQINREVLQSTLSRTQAR